jgi:hypothetical protein
MTSKPEERFEVSVKYILFDGSESAWREWKGKTMAFALKRGFKKALEADVPLIKEEEYYEESTTEKQKREYKANVDAYSYLAMSCTGTAYGHIENCRSTRAPDGDACEAWNALISRYESSDIGTDYVTIEEGFQACKLEGLSSDPDVWF